jgi:1-acyl-sn-glycerol-3-phosphate acyltransferase
MELSYASVVWLTRGLIAARRWPVRFSGLGHLPAEGGAVVASNHISYVDYLFVGLAAHRRGRVMRFAAKRELFEHPLAGPLLRRTGQLRVDRESGAGEVIERMAATAANGEVLGMFPEATISQAFVPKRAKIGAARIALRAGVPLIPAAVWGSQRIKTKGAPPHARSFPRGVAVSVAFAPPVDLSDGDPRAATDRLMGSITALVGDLQRTYPQQPARDDDRWWLPPHLGGTAPTLAEAEELAARESAERSARRTARRGPSPQQPPPDDG